MRPRILGPDAQAGYCLQRELNAASVSTLRALGPIDRLSVNLDGTLTSRTAHRLAALASVRWLWLWCDVTPAAVKRLIRIPGLEAVDVLRVEGKGRLSGFADAADLRTFRANCGLPARDVIAIGACRGLRELGLQGAALAPNALDALIAMPELQSLDIEHTAFDDAMAQCLSASASLRWLEAGATKLTRTGLSHLTRMPQLKGLDLWATPLAAEDFELLRAFPHLEYVSLGGYTDMPLDGTRVVPLLLSLPALKRVWLDGVSLNREQIAALQARLDHVRIT